MLKKSRLFAVIFFIFAVVVFTIYHFTMLVATDHTFPVIEMNSDSVTVSVKDGDEAILEGVTAKDGKDGDITDRLFIESKSGFIEKGRFNAIIAVADGDNHITKIEREVKYSDYKSPQYSLTQPLKFQTTRDTRDDLNIAASLSAKDDIDGNISNKIKISSEYSIYGSGNIPGDYPMEFIVTNSMGDTVRLPVTITIYSAMEESGLPEIVLSSYLVNTSVGASVDLENLVEQIEYHNETYRRGDDGNFYNGKFDSAGNPEMYEADSLRIHSDVDWNTPGVYEVNMTFTDRKANISNFIRCYVVID